MKISERFLFRAETIDGHIFHLTACCLGEALYKSEDYTEKHYKDDLVDKIEMMYGELLEDEELDRVEAWDKPDGKAEGKKQKLALVVGRIEGKKHGEEESVT